MPTVSGREAKLLRAVRAYQTLTPPDVIVHLVIMRGYSTCGAAWQIGSDLAWCDAKDHQDGHYLHYSADDLEPWEGWYEAAVARCSSDESPAPVVFRPDGSIESAGAWGVELEHGEPSGSTVIPFFPLSAWPQVDPIPEIHYHSDDYVSAKLNNAGRQVVVDHGYRFTHYLDEGDPGRDVYRGDEALKKQQALGEDGGWLK
jgi:hypothetical protein